jgi:Rieske Fe-S protein
MDVHNIRMYGLNIKDLTLAKNPKGDKAKATNHNKIVNYVTLCTDYGTENLWNSWCNFLATKSARWQYGNHVSEVHYTYLTGEY